MENKELKRRNLQERGITLVALVVTIIILLILAGVTLNLALGEGGIFARAKNTADRYQAAQANEVDQLAQLEEMLNSYGQGGSTGGGEETTNTVTPQPPTPSEGTGSGEVSKDLDEYQGKYVDIGVNINGNESTADDWELFYASNDKIFLIAADYVPVTQLSTWGVIDALKGNGFQQSSSSYKYNVNWSTPTGFSSNLPDLTEVMHTGYDLKNHQGASDYNSIAVSHLLDTNAWSGIKTAAGEKGKYIDYAIGGPTLEMWCEAWNNAVGAENATFKQIQADGSGRSGYYVGCEATGKTKQTYLYMNGTTSDLGSDLTTLGNDYKTFFPHVGEYNSCSGYWLASPSQIGSVGLVCLRVAANVGGSGHGVGSLGVRPVVSLQSGVRIVERADKDNIYDLATD